jgi:uncharacterized protein
MPKKFIFVLITFQVLLTFLHWLVYKLFLYFFPQLLPQHVLLLVILILLSVSFLCFSALSYKRDNPVLVVGYILAGTWLICGFYLTAALTVALIIYLILGVNITLLGLSAVCICILLTIYGLINARTVRLIKLNIKLPNLPEVWRGKILVMVSDLHLGQVLRSGTAKKIVKLINEQKPEIVLIPGDFYDGVHTDFLALAAPFKNISAPLGTYFCSGNHEVYAGYEMCEQSLQSAKVKILEDEKIEIQGLQILGLAYKNETAESVAHRLKNIGLNTNKPSILLKHVPNHLSATAASGINLQLSGHTHLGQVWPFRYITKKVFKGFDYGLKSLGSMQIYTSSGVGTWGPPLRVFTNSEIIKITLE